MKTNISSLTEFDNELLCKLYWKLGVFVSVFCVFKQPVCERCFKYSKPTELNIYCVNRLINCWWIQFIQVLVFKNAVFNKTVYYQRNHNAHFGTRSVSCYGNCSGEVVQGTWQASGWSPLLQCSYINQI